MQTLERGKGRADESQKHQGASKQIYFKPVILSVVGERERRRQPETLGHVVDIKGCRVDLIALQRGGGGEESLRGQRRKARSL